MAQSILLEAEGIVHGARQADYGHPRDNHARTAALWNAYITGKYNASSGLNAEDVCFLMVLQKISRQMNAPKRDNLVDIAGYTANIEMLHE